MLKELLSYGLKGGQKFSEELGYVTLMDVVAENALAALDEITLPQSADTSTSLRVRNDGSAPDSITQAVKDAVEEVEEVAIQKSVSKKKPSDVKADDVSVEDAAVKEEDDVSVPDKAAETERDDDSRPKDQQRGES